MRTDQYRDPFESVERVVKHSAVAYFRKHQEWPTIAGLDPKCWEFPLVGFVRVIEQVPRPRYAFGLRSPPNREVDHLVLVIGVHELGADVLLLKRDPAPTADWTVFNVVGLR